MNNYEKLLDEAKQNGVDVTDINFESDRIKGLYCDNTIAINKNIETTSEKACVLAEELGHHYTTFGNIMDQKDTGNTKQELKARMIAYNKQVGLIGIINAYRKGCKNSNEMADFLDVTEEFLIESLEAYRRKYGLCTTLDNYIIYFEPSLGVLEKI